MRLPAQEGMTMIIVTHDIDIAREVSDDDVVFMDIADRNPPSDILRCPKNERARGFLTRILLLAGKAEARTPDGGTSFSFYCSLAISDLWQNY
jgi:polar amino acid transport system ATP-binding protein